MSLKRKKSEAATRPISQITSAPILLVSNKTGRIRDFPILEASGMKAGHFFRLHPSELIKLPQGSELFMLPDRFAVGYDSASKRFVTVDGYFAVSAFMSPGYAVTYNSAYTEIGHPEILPLFSYGAVALYKGEFYVASVRVDRELRQDLRLMDIRLVRNNVKSYRKLFPKNRLVEHLEGCALTYGCPAAKNFFLKRYEAPLPTSPYCNSECLGCISYQRKPQPSITQPRIKFFPNAREIADVALFHIKNVNDPVVSFGQGCEGEPLLAEKTIREAIKLIRNETQKGIINMNTNASIPRAIERLFDAGLNSIRVSLNSCREEYYLRYYKPKGYRYKDVLRSIEIAKKKKGFVSLNYLTMPGFTDSWRELSSLEKLIERYRIDMIQWRNLNYDPLRYFEKLKAGIDNDSTLGIREAIFYLKKKFPGLMIGYFNPSRGRISLNSLSLKRRG
ncbi:MAG: radical SAM protein [Candidatus Omnitrophota bacterium]